MKLGYNKNMAILNDDEFVEVGGRSYLNPQVALDESNKFIDNLRETQQTNNQQIQVDTQNLGTDVPSNLGGLTGSDSYFTSRYQVPQTNSAVADLRSAAQAAALNQVLQNEQDIWKKRYNDAYRAYQKRSNAGGGGGGNGGNGNGNSSTWNGQTTKTSTDDDFIYWIGQDGNVWVKKNGTTTNLGAANMINGQWDGKPSGSNGSMNGNGTKINDPNPSGKADTPPNPEDYYIDGKEQSKRIQERSGWPDWLINITKIMG